MISGVQIISTRVLDGRRTLVIGMGMLSFFAVSVYPLAFASTPKWAQPLVTSPLVMATLVALSLLAFCQPTGPIRLDISFDEFKIEATITYDGAALDFPARPPTEDEIIETEEGARQLAGFLIRRYADRLHATSKDGRAVVELLFDH
jgi:hypothetical protein